MKLSNNIGLLAFAICLFVASAAGKPTNLLLGNITLLKQYDAQVDENFVYGEVKGIPYTAFESHSGKPLEKDFYKYLVNNAKNLKLTIKYSDSQIVPGTNVQPTIDTSSGKNLFGFKFELRAYPYGRVVLKGKKQYFGHYKESESQLVFFEKVNVKTDLQALEAELEDYKNLSVRLPNTTTYVNITKVDIDIREINSTEGSVLYLTFSQQG